MLKSSDDIYLLVLLGMAGTCLLSAGIILFYIRYQKKFYQQREQMQQAELNYQVQVLHSTISSQEDERKRIGRDLHDEVGGALANLRVVISNMVKAESPEALRQLVLNSQVLTDGVINTARHISHNLSPSGLEIFGFSEVLAELCDHTASATGLFINLKNNTSHEPTQVDMNISIALYRVMQELLANTIKHAGARTITIDINCSANVLVIDYTDDGRGIGNNGGKATGIGMHNIESRLSMIHAPYNITAPQNQGFKIHIEVPLNVA